MQMFFKLNSVPSKSCTNPQIHTRQKNKNITDSDLMVESDQVYLLKCRSELPLRKIMFFNYQKLLWELIHDALQKVRMRQSVHVKSEPESFLN